MKKFPWLALLMGAAVVIAVIVVFQVVWNFLPYIVILLVGMAVERYLICKRHPVREDYDKLVASLQRRKVRS